MMEKVKLEDICQINMGKTPSRDEPKYWRGNHTWVAIADLKGDVLISKTKEGITDLALKECGIKPVSKGTLLYSFKLSIGKVAITDKELYTNEAIVALPIKDSKQVDLKYLYYAIQQVDLTGIGDKAVKGITLNKEKLKRLEIPLPTLEKQQQIAHILDKADALRRKDRELLQQYDALAQAIFIEMFGDPVRNERGWKIQPFGTCLEAIVAGSSFGGEEKPLEANELGVLKISAVTTGIFKPTEYKAIPKKVILKDVIFVKKGDLLFSRANTRELVGATCIVDNDYDHLFLPDKLWRLDLNRTLCHPIFIKFLLSQACVRFELNKTATGTSGSMLNISMQKLKALPIIVPPLSVQETFKEKLVFITQSNVITNQSSQQSETLFQSLLQGAFSSSLVIP